MSSSPTVSVVIPAYRAVATVGAALSGALTQSYSAVEVVCVDDGSPDSTASVVAAYGEAVHLIRQENAGVSAARNAGAAAATGSLLVFCDSDDTLLPSAVERMVAVWSSGPPRRIVTVNAYPLTLEGINPRRHRVLERFPAGLEAQRLEILRCNFVNTISLIPADVFRELGGYDPTLPVSEDWDLWLRAIYAGVEVDYVREPQALYRWQPGSLSADKRRMIEGEEELFRRFASRAKALTPAEQRLLTERLEHGSPSRSKDDAAAALQEGRVAQAAAGYARAARLLPHDRRLAMRALTLRRMPATARLWRRRDRDFLASTGRLGS